MRELHAQLEGPEAEVDAQHVVGRAVLPGVRQRRVQLAEVAVVLLGAVRVDHAAEVEGHHAGDAAEEGEADEHVERELELGLADVVAVAEQARVAEAEPAQVVEAGKIEPAPEPAALRRARRGPDVEVAAADDAESLDGVGLQIGEEAVLAAGGQIARAQRGDERRPTDGATLPVAGGVPAVAAADFGLRIEAADLVEVGGREVGGGAAKPVVGKVVEELALHAHQPRAALEAAEGGQGVREQPFGAGLLLEVEHLAGGALVLRRERLVALPGAGELRVAALLEGVKGADAPHQPVRLVDIKRQRVGQVERPVDGEVDERAAVAHDVGEEHAARADRGGPDSGAADGRAAAFDPPVLADVERIVDRRVPGNAFVGKALRLVQRGQIAGRNRVLLVDGQHGRSQYFEEPEARAVEGDPVDAVGREARVREAGGKIGDALDAPVLQEPEVGLAAGLAGEDHRAAVQHHGKALVGGRVGEPRARARLRIDAEEVEAAALGGVAGVDDAVLAPGEVALAVEIIGEAVRVRIRLGEVERVDVDLAVAVEAVERELRAVRAEGGVARFDDPVADDVDFAGRAEVDVDPRAGRAVVLALAPVHRPDVQQVGVARLREPGDRAFADGHHRAQDRVQALGARMLVDGELLRRRGIAPVEQHQLGAPRLALDAAVEEQVAVARADEGFELVGHLQLGDVG